jgi:hypothetical protein
MSSELEKLKYNIADFKEVSPGNMVYRPDSGNECTAQNVTLGVKFSNDVYLHKSFLDQQKIDYKEEELEDTPNGRCLRIKR